ncbi:ATP-binding cassette domain-containing protein [Salinibacterium sp.]|uniref:ABC transporter ATP-binding protein/permease n=1 Tax=Salinibacterium sp. TaxID=1915057 RepID=UPI00286C7BB3|nr:ATP-binding cassette domain-containing protein [Salinibacterium sp.]
MSDASVAEDTATPLLELRSVGRVYDDGARTAALTSVDLVIHEGDYVAIVGPSGSGKSTLLNILGLLDRPSTGTYRIRGQDVQTASERDRNRLRSRTFGFVFQASHVVGALTAASNAGLGLEISGLPRRERVARVTRALTMLGIASRANFVAKNLSGGERQRVAVARAIATNPAVILADEPTGALDSENSATVIDYLGELNSRGVTVIVITHDPTVAARAHRQVEIRDGVLNDVIPTGVSALTGESTATSSTASPTSNANRASPPAQRRYPGRFLRTLALELFTAVSAHTTAPARSLVLIFAFLLGTGGLVSALGISQSAAAQVSDRLTAAALDEVVIDDNLGSGVDAIASIPVIEARIKAIDRVIGVGWSARVAPGDSPISLLPPGSFLSQPRFDGPRMVATAGYLDVIGAQVEPAGVASLFTDAGPEIFAIVGDRAAELLGVAAPGPGVRLWLNGHPVEVVGFASGSERDPLLADSVILSKAAVDVISGWQPTFTVRTEPGFPAAVAEALPSAISPANPGQVHTSTVADLRSLRRGVAADLGTLIAIVSLILLALSTLSAGTTMFVSVRSRAPEIALRRALGASRASVWRLFSLEGLVIGLAGGVAGSAFGLLAVVAVCQLQQWTPVLSPAYLGVGIVAGVVSGLISAVYPALVAAFSNPADAVRG